MTKRLLSLPLVVLVLIALLVAGCGGSKSKSDTGTPLSQVLAFYPKDSAVVATFASNPNGPQVKAALALVRKVPGGSLLLDQAKSSIPGGSGIDVDKDLLPALGDQIALGSNSAADINGRKVLIVVSAKGPGKLKGLLDKDKKSNPVTSEGDYKGAKLYGQKSGGSFYAVDGKTLVLGESEAQIKAALDVRDAKTGLTEADWNKANGTLPKAAFVHIYGDAASLVNSSASATKAKSVPWVAALKTYALSISAANSRVQLGFHLDTTGANLTPRQLPFSTGAQAPGLISGPPLVVGLRALAPSLTFAEDVASKISPTQYGQFQTALSVIRGRTKVDIEKDIAGQFTGDAVFGSDLSTTYLLRSAVKDPAAMKASLAKLFPLAGNFLQGAGLQGAKVAKAGDGIYSISEGATPKGSYGVVGDNFLAGNTSVTDLKAAAAQSATPPAGAKGALAVKIDSATLVKLALARSSAAAGLGAVGSIVSGLLGDVTGSAEMEQDGLTGEFSLAVK
jgi:hypothetical protein